MAPRAPSKRPPWAACTPGAAAEDASDEAAEPVDDAVESAPLVESAVVELAVEVALPEALRVELLTRIIPVPVAYAVVALPAGKVLATYSWTVVLAEVGTADELAWTLEALVA